MNTPFSTRPTPTNRSRTRRRSSVGDVLLNDPGVRVARGFGNFQESYFIRGFILNSDSVAYNGLYGLLPRQYISAELFERVEVLRGASAFLNGATPNSDAIGGSINLLPKRAPSLPLTQMTVGTASGGADHPGRRRGSALRPGQRHRRARQPGLARRRHQRGQGKRQPGHGRHRSGLARPRRAPVRRRRPTRTTSSSAPAPTSRWARPPPRCPRRPRAIPTGRSSNT